MRKASAAKVIGDVDGLAPGVAEHEAEKQRTLTSGQTIGTVHEKTTQRVGGAHPRRALRARADVVDSQQADDMSRRQPRGAGWRPLETADNENTLTCLRNPQLVNASTRPSDRLHVTTIVEAHVGAHP
jgi:hypothetical protein